MDKWICKTCKKEFKRSRKDMEEGKVERCPYCGDPGVFNSTWEYEGWDD